MTTAIRQSARFAGWCNSEKTKTYVTTNGNVCNHPKTRTTNPKVENKFYENCTIFFLLVLSSFPVSFAPFAPMVVKDNNKIQIYKRILCV
jgi:hypothetical protein